MAHFANYMISMGLYMPTKNVKTYRFFRAIAYQYGRFALNSVSKVGRGLGKTSEVPFLRGEMAS